MTQFAIKIEILAGKFKLILSYMLLIGFLLPALSLYENIKCLTFRRPPNLPFKGLVWDFVCLFALYSELLNQKNQKDCCISQHFLLCFLGLDGKGQR